jgi:arylsulfatase A-like enzyme
MSFRIFSIGPACLSLLFVIAGLRFAVAATAVARPNVLFIAVDDLNDWIGCLGGHPQAKTPHIDRLAARGTLFANAHCQAPLCNPSRASLLTGLRPSTTGVYGLQPGIRDVAMLKQHLTLPQYFAQHGYRTACFGKVFHDGSIPPRERTNEFHVWGEAGAMPYPPRKLVETPDPMKAVDWGIFPEDDREQADWKIATAAIAHLEAQTNTPPFFLAVGFRLPHVPCFASKKWFDLYPEEGVVLPPVKDDDRDDLPLFASYLRWRLPEPRLAWLKSKGQWRPLVRAYLASTSFMDSQVGRLIDALDKSGRASNTVVVFWSDHGWHLGEKGITGKNTLWERSTRVPLVFAGPGVSKNARCARPVELLDLYPTLLELCGLPARSGLEGHTLAPQLKDAGAPRPWPAITTHNHDNHAVRTEEWRYIRYADGSEELYAERADPNEWFNLARDPRHAGVKRELAKWLPKSSAPPVPGSAQRVLLYTNGVAVWEGKVIRSDETMPQ